MGADLREHGGIPDALALLGRMDRELSQAVTVVRRESTTVYQAKAPGRVSGGVKVRRSSARGQYLVITIGKVPMGGKVQGRDVGTQAVAYFTNFGTTGPIRRRPGTGQHHAVRRTRTGKRRSLFASTEGPRPPFRLANGVYVGEVKGQRPQRWVDEARRQADAAATVQIEQHLSDDLTHALQRML